jgi:hypothetical protein
MGDRLRQVLYPLVLPLIVATIWLCGWVRQQEDHLGRAGYLPPSAPAVQQEFLAAHSAAPERVARDDQDGLATADAFADSGREIVDEP